jgi:hypothetical protein
MKCTPEWSNPPRQPFGCTVNQNRNIRLKAMMIDGIMQP